MHPTCQVDTIHPPRLRWTDGLGGCARSPAWKLHHVATILCIYIYGMILRLHISPKGSQWPSMSLLEKPGEKFALHRVRLVFHVLLRWETLGNPCSNFQRTLPARHTNEPVLPQQPSIVEHSRTENDWNVTDTEETHSHYVTPTWTQTSAGTTCWSQKLRTSPAETEPLRSPVETTETTES